MLPSNASATTEESNSLIVLGRAPVFFSKFVQSNHTKKSWHLRWCQIFFAFPFSIEKGKKKPKKEVIWTESAIEIPQQFQSFHNNTNHLLEQW